MTDLSPVAECDFFQFGYVTGHLQRSIDLWKARYGVRQFFTFDTRDGAMPGKTGPFLKVALGYQGPVMIELIEPDRDDPGIYGHALTPDGHAQLHHFGFLADAEKFDGMKARFEAQGSPVPTYLTGGPTLLYADTRADNGLFTEVVARTDYMLALFAKIPPFR